MEMRKRAFIGPEQAPMLNITDKVWLTGIDGRFNLVKLKDQANLFQMVNLISEITKGESRVYLGGSAVDNALAGNPRIYSDLDLLIVGDQRADILHQFTEYMNNPSSNNTPWNFEKVTSRSLEGLPKLTETYMNGLVEQSFEADVKNPSLLRRTFGLIPSTLHVSVDSLYNPSDDRVFPKISPLDDGYKLD